jgi:peroxiredoxin
MDEYPDMDQHPPLAETLDLCRTSPGAWVAAYDDLIARLRASGATDGAPRPGDRLTDFALADVEGRPQRLSDLVAQGPVVLSFNRGSWCPFCEAEVAAWSRRLDDLAALNGRLVIVTPETGGRMAALGALAAHRATILCDSDFGLALRMGLAFPVGRAVLQELLDDGLDLAIENGTASGFLPVPATFVIDTACTVRSAHVNPDFSYRAEPSDVLAAVASLRSPG